METTENDHQNVVNGALMPKTHPCREQAAALEDMPVAEIPQPAISNFCSEQDQEAVTAVLPFLSEFYSYQGSTTMNQRVRLHDQYEKRATPVRGGCATTLNQAGAIYP